jgi:hypothetical protein
MIVDPQARPHDEDDEPAPLASGRRLSVEALAREMEVVKKQLEIADELMVNLKFRVPILLDLERKVCDLTTRFESMREVPSPLQPRATRADTADDLQTRFDDIVKEINDLGPTPSPVAINNQVVDLRFLVNTVDSRTTVLVRSIVSVAYDASSANHRAHSHLQSINRKASRRLAQAYLSDMEKQAKFIQPLKLLEIQDVLAPELQQAVGAMNEIADDFCNLKPIVTTELARVRRTEVWVVLYSLCTVLTVVAIIALAIRLNWAEVGLAGSDMDKLGLPVLGIPWPVVVWGLLGGIAATMHRFNRHPSYDFTDAAKWIVTRPIQGAFLAAAAYLVLHSGMLILSGAPSTDATSQMSNTVMLVVSFLIGFSDRVSDGIFNTLVQRYPDPNSPTPGSAANTEPRADDQTSS